MPPPTKDNDDEDECFFSADLFLNKATKRLTYRIQELEQTVLASTSSSTDHDLTGQIVWPVSVFLAWYVASQRDRLQGLQVLEVGAGCAGLPGLIAARFASRAVLTDGNEVVLETLARNVGEEAAALDNVESRSLLWGDAQSAHALLDARCRPQVVLGADVVCWPDMVGPLLQTVKFLFQQAPDPTQAVLFLGFVNRATSTERILYAQAHEMGMAITKVPAASFLPADPEAWPSELRNAQQKLELLTVALDPALPGHKDPVVFDAQDRMAGRATPC